MAVTKGRRARDAGKNANQVYEPGVQGRKTGITLPQGARDEHGIEDLDGIFSSPEKPAPQHPSSNGNRTLTSSDMQLAQSASSRKNGARIGSAREADYEDDIEGSAPEPTEVLSTRRVTLKSSKSTFPPPSGRSPYKTNIGSSPRRQSSVKPRRTATDTPELLQPRPTVTRRLDFGANGDVTALEGSSLRKPARRKSAVPPPRQDIYALEVTDEEDVVEQEVEEPELPVPDESLQFVQDDGYDGAPVIEEPSEMEQISSPTRRRTSRMSDRHSHIEQDEVEEYTAPVVPSTKKKGRPSRRSLQDEDAPAQSSKAAQKPVQRRGGKAQLRSTKQPQPVEESTISIDESVIDPSLLDEPPRSKPTTSKGKGKGRSRQLPTPEETQPSADDPIETTELDDSFIAPPPPPKQRGKPASKRKLAVYEESEAEVEEIPDVDEATEMAPPTKKAKKTAAATKKSNKAPKERDLNIMPPPSFAKPSLPQHGRGSSTAPTGARWDESMWANSRNMSRLRDPTPSAEAMVGRTRSGRQVIKPLNHFANERAQYGRDGTLLAVQTAETVERPTAAGGARARGGSRAPSKAPGRGVSRRRNVAEETIAEEDEENDDADEMEDWEARGEMIYGEVNGYDALTGQTTDDMFETELAWSSTSVPLMPVSSANFGFVKLLSMPFFGSGIMDFPVGGYKKPRNSGKTSLHVFVHTGKVFVRIGGTKVVGSRFKKGKGKGGDDGEEVEGGNAFVVSRGGSFHVPRGNLYEIQNVSERNARLFFAQGTEIVVAE